MKDIEFEIDENYKRGVSSSSQSTPSTQGPLIKIVIKLGVKDPRIVSFILIVVAIIFFGVAVFLYADVFGGSNKQIQTSSDIMLMESVSNSTL